MTKPLLAILLLLPLSVSAEDYICSATAPDFTLTVAIQATDRGYDLVNMLTSPVIGKNLESISFALNGDQGNGRRTHVMQNKLGLHLLLHQGPNLRIWSINLLDMGFSYTQTEDGGSPPTVLGGLCSSTNDSQP